MPFAAAYPFFRIAFLVAGENLLSVPTEKN